MGMRVLGLMSGSLIQGSGARKTTLCQPRAFDFEGQQGLISGATQKWEKGDFILKGHTQNSLCPGTQGKSDDLRGGRVRATCWSWKASGRGRGQRQLTLGAQTLVADTSSHTDAAAGGAPLTR